MIDFLIVYEVPVREFESISLVGGELKKRGYSVEYLGFEEVQICDYAFNKRIINKFFNKVNTVLMPSLYHNKELMNIVYYVCGKCVHVVNIRWEQYFSNHNMEDFTSYLYPHERAMEAFHMCWGKVSRESLLAAGLKDEKLLQAGPVHLDLLRKQFKGYYLTREELFPQYSINTQDKVVLFISSFVGATRTERQRNFDAADFDRKYEKNSKDTFSQDSYFEILHWIELFLKDNPGVTFIYRPHPNENITGFLQEVAERNEKFKIICDYSVKQWIIDADSVLTWVSTSIVEACFADVQCSIVRPIPYEPDKDMCIYKNVHAIDGYSDFSQCLNGNFMHSLKKEELLDYYDFQETPSYKRLCNLIETVVLPSDPFAWDDDLVKAYEKHRPVLWINSLIQGVYMQFVLKPFSWLKRKYHFKYFSWLDQRCENYNTYITKNRYQKKNRENLIAIQNKLLEFMD